MAYSLDQLMTALRNADAAGDVDGAKRIAQLLSSNPTSQPQQEPSLAQQAGDFLTGGQSGTQIAEEAGRGLPKAS